MKKEEEPNYELGWQMPDVNFQDFLHKKKIGYLSYGIGLLIGIFQDLKDRSLIGPEYDKQIEKVQEIIKSVIYEIESEKTKGGIN